MKIWFRPITLEEITLSREMTMVEHVGIQFVAIGDDFLKATMPIDMRTRQPMGILHGGASCVLAETLASVAANFVVNPETSFCVGLEINTSHIKMASKGMLTGTASPLHLGKSTQLWEIPIVNQEKELISISRLRLAVLERRKK